MDETSELQIECLKELELKEIEIKDKDDGIEELGGEAYQHTQVEANPSKYLQVCNTALRKKSDEPDNIQKELRQSQQAPYSSPSMQVPFPTQPTNLFQPTLPAILTIISTPQTIPPTFCTHPTAETKFAAFNSPCVHSTPELLTIFLCAHTCSTDTTRYGISLIAISIQSMLFPALIEHVAHAKMPEVGSMQAQEIARRK
ncbi:hypothetical protein VTO58DRAFT_103120 [Aureobasidium pullulans]|nr:hypothetical protein JADG_004338 [Aureobasidium pullulans]KAG2164601.1 hypothetical protein JADG_004340 [Aureobasidium pullulans]